MNQGGALSSPSRKRERREEHDEEADGAVGKRQLREAVAAASEENIDSALLNDEEEDLDSEDAVRRGPHGGGDGTNGDGAGASNDDGDGDGDDDDDREGRHHAQRLGRNDGDKDSHDATSAADAVAVATATYQELLQHDRVGGSGDDEMDEQRRRHLHHKSDSFTEDGKLVSMAEAHDQHAAHSQISQDEDAVTNDALQHAVDQAGPAAGRRGRRPGKMSGSDEWRKLRKDSHKEVERRRRENINTAITALSELLPVKESSKAAILARAAEYIEKLKETENANIDKWTLQKLLSDQNASQLANANEKLQEELGNAYKEINLLKSILKKHAIDYEEELKADD